MVAAFMSLLGYTAWSYWAPAPHGIADGFTAVSRAAESTSYSMFAHQETTSQMGNPVEYAAASDSEPFPTDQIVELIRSTMGADANPIVLSYDQRLFSFAAVAQLVTAGPFGRKRADRSGIPATRSYSNWPRSVIRLRSLKQTANTHYGSIDVFVLQTSGPSWADAGVSFSLSQFDPIHFAYHQGDESTSWLRSAGQERDLRLADLGQAQRERDKHGLNTRHHQHHACEGHPDVARRHACRSLVSASAPRPR